MAIGWKEYRDFRGETVRRTRAVLLRVRNALEKVRSGGKTVSDETIQGLIGMEKDLSALAESQGEMASEQIDELIISAGQLEKILGQPVGDETVKDMMADSPEDKAALEEELGEYDEIYGAAPAEQISEELAKKDMRTSAEWIEEYQSRISDKDGYVDDAILGKYKATNEDDLENLVMIMAAASLAARDRSGKPDQQTKFSLTEMKEKAAEIKASPSFQQYVDYIKTTEDWEENKKAAKDAKIKRLQKAMIAYLSTKGSANLADSPLYGNFMPTVKDRLAHLRALLRKGGDVAGVAAELVVLMNKTKGNVERPITIFDRISMSEQIHTLKHSPLFQSLANSKEGKNMLLKDNVGDFMKSMREAGRNLPKEMIFKDSEGPSGFVNVDVEFKDIHNKEDDEAMKIINANTVGGCMQACREKAKEIADRMRNTHDPVKISQLIVQAKMLISEYFVLNGFLTKRDGSYDLENMEKNKEADVDWGKFNRRMANVKEKPPLGVLFENFQERNAMTMLRNLQYDGFQDFFSKLGNEYRKAVEAKKQIVNEAKPKDAPKSGGKKIGPAAQVKEEPRILLPNNDRNQQ